MPQTLGKLTYGKLVGILFPGIIAGFSAFCLVDSAMVKPGVLSNWVISDITGVTAFTALLLVLGMIMGVLLDNTHYALLVPLYKKTQRFKQLAERERPKIDLIRLLVLDNFRRYGVAKLKSQGDQVVFEKKLAHLWVDDLEWWFILPVSGGSVLNLFLEEYHTYFQFFGGMFFALISLGLTSYIYTQKVLTAGSLQTPLGDISSEIIVSMFFLAVGIFCLRRAYRWHLLCYETQINLMFGTIVDQAFQKSPSIQSHDMQLPT